MRMEHFEIWTLKLIKKIISLKLMDQLNCNFVQFSKSSICSIEIIISCNSYDNFKIQENSVPVSLKEVLSYKLQIRNIKAQ